MALPYKKTTGSSSSKDKKQQRPIIIKRARKAPPAPHHGGAWKVAYADFVTAMMAFFLLLWLISTSSEATLQGIAEYFTPVSGLKDNRPIGVNNVSLSPMDKTDPGINLSAPGPVQAEAGSLAGDPENSVPEPTENADADLFKQVETAMSQAISKDPALSQYKDNISIGQTPEGLRIDLNDSGKYPMFELNSMKLTEHGQSILSRLVPLIKRMPNYMSVTGYTDGSVLETGGNGFRRWELSAGRAQAALKYMLESGLEPERPQKVQGIADNELLLPDEPRSGRNRRITLVMLRGSHILIPQSAVPETAK